MKPYLLSIFILLGFYNASFSQRLLKNIAAGTANARIFSNGTYVFGDTLFFKADDISEFGSSYQYFFTTGTSVSTKKIYSASPLSFTVSSHYYEPNFHKFKGKTFGYNTGKLLEFRNDSLVVIKSFGSAYAEFLDFFELNGYLYFLTFEPLSNRYEFWQTDGTTSGTIRYKLMPNNNQSYNKGDSFIINNTFYKFISNDEDLRTLLFTDGSSSGTGEIENNKIEAYGFVTINNEAYFSKTDTGQYWYRNKLYKSQGDSLSTIRVLDDIEGDIHYGVYNLFKFKNELYFQSITQSGNKISKYDANSATVEHITNKQITSSNVFFSADKIYYFSYLNNAWHFYENDGNLASENLLFSTSQILPYDHIKLYIGNTKLYILQLSTIDYTIAYWSFDGQNLVKIKDLNSEVELGVSNNTIGVAGDYFYFSGGDQLHGYELWRTDGSSAEGTFMLKDINKTMASSFPKFLFGLGDYFYLLANDIKHGAEIWRTNGASTNLHADLNGSYLSKHTFESLYYTGANLKNSYIANINRKLYRFDLNGALEVIFPYVENISNLCSFKESVYFCGNDYNLWKTDGTVLGTKQAINLNDTGNGSNNWGTNVLTQVDTLLYFTSNYGSKLWATNGTKNGTLKLKEFQSNEIAYDNFDASDYPTLYSCGKNLFFERRNTSLNRRELWASDGTIAGTTELTNDFYKLGCFNDKFYFNKDNNLWVSDGTPAGTFKRSDINFFSVKQLKNELYLLELRNNSVKYYKLNNLDSLIYLNTSESFYSPNSYLPNGFVNIDNRYLLNYVTSTTSPQYTYFFLTDGNKENIKKSFTLKNSIPVGGYNFTYYNKKIYFSAKDSLNGQELWVWDFECPDGFTERDSIGKDTTIVYGKNIWGQNVIHNNKNIVYDASNSIILQPGFEVKQGSVFRTRLIGCNNTNLESNPSTEESEKFAVYKEESKIEYPQLSDFINFQPNLHIRRIYEESLMNNSSLSEWKISKEKDIYVLTLQMGKKTFQGFLPIK